MTTAICRSFRFFLVCRAASYRVEDQFVSINGIVNELEVDPDEPIELVAVVSVFSYPTNKGKYLGLVFCRLDESGVPQQVEGYAGNEIELESGTGPIVMPCPFEFSVKEAGVYGFYLIDRNGAFVEPDSCLGTYLFFVNLK